MTNQSLDKSFSKAVARALPGASSRTRRGPVCAPIGPIGLQARLGQR